MPSLHEVNMCIKHQNQRKTSSIVHYFRKSEKTGPQHIKSNKTFKSAKILRGEFPEFSSTNREMTFKPKCDHSIL